MTPTNGRLTAQELVEVEKGLFLERLSARAYRRLKAQYVTLHHTLTIARPAGAYRDYNTQHWMRLASVGTDPAEKRRWGLASNSRVPLAAPGYSSHGMGTAADLLVDGRTPTARDRELFADLGWTWQFGAADPNHFIHIGRAGTAPVSRKFCLTFGLFVQPDKSSR